MRQTEIKREWIEPERVDVPDEIRALTGGHKLTAEILIRRGYQDVTSARAFLDPDFYQPASPFEMPGMAQAVKRLRQAIETREKILIWGDFDVDGQTATTLLVTALRRTEAEVRFYIPDRQKEGHGIHVDRLKTLLDQEDIRLVVTCDTGIAAHEAIQYAQSSNVDVIVTDHHQLPEVLPPAYVCINPQMLPSTHPLHTLPGVGCAFKVMEALFNELHPDETVDDVLDLVASGIVADVAVQTGDTRYLLQRGLVKLRQNQRVGLQVIMEIAEVAPGTLDEEQISFVIAPRLNALGRLGDANDAVELLSTQDEVRARVLAYRLEGYNNERKLLTQQIFDSAQKQIEENSALLDSDVLVVAHPMWAGGVLGIVANRLTEVYLRPAVVLTNPPGELAHGSARSVEGIDITAAITRCSELLTGYGGHTMAAGVTLASENIDTFRRMLARMVREQKPSKHLASELYPDGYIHLADVTPELISSLRMLSPFGPGNSPVLLGLKGLRLLRWQSMGRGGEHYRMTVQDETGSTGNVVWWRADHSSIPSIDDQFDMVCNLHVNTYRGKSEIQLELVDLRPLVNAASVRRLEPDQIKLHDYRASAQPEQVLLQILQSGESVGIWNESDEIAGVNSQRRSELQPCEMLVVWTAPPSPFTWQKILRQTQPREISLFAVIPELHNSVDAYLKRIAGLTKYAIQRYNGEIDILKFVELTGQEEEIVSAALEWFGLQNKFRIVNKEDSKMKLEKTAPSSISSDSENLTGLYQRIEALFKESRAYRGYFQRVSTDMLLSGKER